MNKFLSVFVTTPQGGGDIDYTRCNVCRSIVMKDFYYLELFGTSPSMHMTLS